jgi:hypothetical protein
VYYTYSVFCRPSALGSPLDYAPGGSGRASFATASRSESGRSLA